MLSGKFADEPDRLSSPSHHTDAAWLAAESERCREEVFCVRLDFSSSCYSAVGGTGTSVFYGQPNLPCVCVLQ